MNRVHAAVFGCRAVMLLSAALCAGQPPPVLADDARLTVEDFGPMGSYGGRTYTWATGTLTGAVNRPDGTDAQYSVPITLNYPDRDSNGFGFMDFVNVADFSSWVDETALLGMREVAYTGYNAFSDYLRREGFTYASVQWSRTVAEQLGPDYGVIESALDGYEITRDVARILRAPEGRVQGDLPFALQPVDHIVGYGISSSGSLLLGMMLRGADVDDDGSLLIDGFLANSTNGQMCRVFTDDATLASARQPEVSVFNRQLEPCPPLPENSKLIVLRMQGEIEHRDQMLTREQTPTIRRYDVAGVPHAAEFDRNLRYIGVPNQNPVSWRPLAKAMLNNLVEWIVTGREPPPPLYLDGTVDNDGNFHLATDADGNALGGIRLPHMPTVLPDGGAAGAPLGVYGGVNKEYNSSRGFGYAQHGGTFTPFSAEELARRYPTQEVYVDLVRRAAAALLAGRYILQEDHDAYIRAAEQQRLPQ